MAEPRILVVDDEESMCQYLSILLTKEGYDVSTASCGVDALRLMEAAPYDVVLSDIQMPKLDGIQLLKGLKAIDPELPVIMLTAYASEQSAIDAVNLGAYSYLQKHCKNDEIKVAVRNALNLRQATKENVQLKKELRTRRNRSRMVGQSAGMRAVFKMIDKIAATPATILITGESGTGKELIARSIHDRSERANKPFVAINCGAIPETLLESQLFGHVKGAFTGADRDHDGFCRQAEGGTIFLDEIGETPHVIQVKLLRMLQEREIYPVGSSKAVKVDLRVIAATNRDLEQEVAEKNFRPDLFYRLNVIPIELPPLRDRVDDIPLLADHFLRMHFTDYAGSLGKAMTDQALDALMRYDWPGNVRELENVIERSCIIRDGDLVEVDDLPENVVQPAGEVAERPNLVGSPTTLEELERLHILSVLENVGGHKKRAAEILDINPSTLYRKLLRYGVNTGPGMDPDEMDFLDMDQDERETVDA
ncbi:MAG TPA: sigma-54 dependent transcriptional regulator [Candidatus Krumholzibacteria bacterium]|nr:sigma-54 dependent transcriptional regulator [Candidatus Krumholzibacteria bacterium]HRX50673.1 sigma-54 dependent transcriptional regulator [Candidatus Krumholzibacteria bacterium]